MIPFRGLLELARLPVRTEIVWASRNYAQWLVGEESGLLTKSGVLTTLRRLFAKIGVSECYGDFSPTMPLNFRMADSSSKKSPGARLCSADCQCSKLDRNHHGCSNVLAF
jgi:hypothetical protein